MPIKDDLYKINDGDLRIFDNTLRTGNINWFTNYYLRSEDSGTWWRPVSQDDLGSLTFPEFIQKALLWKSGYEFLLQSWMDMGKPEYFIENGNGGYEAVTAERHEAHILFTPRKYRVVQEYEFDTPTFHHNHGMIFLPWQLDMHNSKPDLRVVIGGMGSGKTMAAAVEMLVWAATLKKFRGFALAPFALQANEVYDILSNIVEGTIYEERFIIRTPSKPMKHLVIGNSLVGKHNTIECYPILDDPDKIRTVTGDCAMIDQAEKLPDIEGLLRDVGTRFRGQIAGRRRLGKLTFVANSGDNPALWDLYDDAEADPTSTWAAAPNSADNIYLTIPDMKRYEKVIGTSPEERDMFLRGKRPLGSGEIFPRASIVGMKAHWMDDVMEAGIKAQTEADLNGRNVTERFRHQKAERAGTVRWEIPPEPESDYLVTADPGWKNPPYRDSAAVSVWKITGFPFVPAHMVAFHWVSGNGSPLPWMNQYTDYVLRYRAIGSNAYDATGAGAGYGKMTDINDLLPHPINLGGIKKQAYITLTQKILAKNLLQVPNIEHLFSQLAKYTYPEETRGKMRQDLVMMIVVTCAALEPLWYNLLSPDEERDNDYDATNRYSRPLRSRSSGHARSVVVPRRTA